MTSEGKFGVTISLFYFFCHIFKKIMINLIKMVD